MSVKDQSKRISNTNRKVTERDIASILAYCTIVLCIIAILLPLVIGLFFQPKQKVEINITSIDTLPSKALVISKSDLDSLFHVIEEHEHLLNERYDYVLEQKENELKWQTYITLIIGIIVSICGFFGYKSIRDLKEEVQKETKDSAKKNASYIAKNIAQRVSTQEVIKRLPRKIEQYLDENLQKEVSNQMESIFRNELYSSLQKSLIDFIEIKLEKSSRNKNKDKLSKKEEIILPYDDSVDKMFQNIK